MNRRQFHWLEKLQVQIAAAVALAAVYFLVWPAMAPSDAQKPLVFLYGGVGRLVTAAAVVWVLSAATALLTPHGRPESALVASLIGAGGLAMRSEQVRSLLWAHQSRTGCIYAGFIAEIIVLGLVVFGAAAIVVTVRAVMGRIHPSLRWRSRLPVEEGHRESLLRLLFGAPLSDWRELFRIAAPRSGADRRSHNITNNLGFLTVALVASLALVSILLQSSDRGQILFALLAGSMLAVLLGHQIFPSALGSVAWVIPIITAVILYLLAAFSPVGDGPQDWTDVGLYARALPVDWLTAGCGGAMLGYWISARIHELRHLEAAQGA